MLYSTLLDSSRSFNGHLPAPFLRIVKATGTLLMYKSALHSPTNKLASPFLLIERPIVRS